MSNKLVVFFLLFFASAVFSQAAVLLEPIEGEGVLSIYPFEVKEYSLKVINIADHDLDGVQVVIKVPNELAVVVDGDDRQEAFFTFLSLPADAREERKFKIKALEVSSNPVEIKAEFGIENLNNSSSTSVNIIRSDFSFSSRLSQTSLAPGQKGSVFFDFSNSSEERITNIHAELFSTDAIIIESPELELDFLESGQGISNTEFFFSLDEGTGKKVLGLRLFFTDSKGSHVLEKAFSLDVQNRDFYVFVLVGAIVFLVGISFYLRRKKVPRKVDSEGIKLESIEKDNKSGEIKIGTIKEKK